MKTITLKTGEKIEFELLKYNENNLSKTNLTINGVDSEGIWIILSDKDKIDMENDKKDGYFVAMLANNALNFIPKHSWGLHIVCKHNGENRCRSDVTWVDYDNPSNWHIEEQPDDNDNEEE